MDLLGSLIRTLVPLVVGWLIGLAARRGLDVDSADLTALVTGAVTALYYALARVLERYVSPRFGWLLGLPRQPVYVKPPAVVQDKEGYRIVDETGGVYIPFAIVVFLVLILALWLT